MKPEKLTIREIFSRERRFVIPLFQRSYVWNREEQWEPLWEDISKCAEAHLAASGHEQVRTHFLGAIVLNLASTQGREVARSDVIDGQQRLTTLQLFLAALRDLSVQREAHRDDVSIFSRVTRNPDCGDDSDQVFKVWPTNADRDVFAAVLRAGSLAGVEEALAEMNGQMPRMAEAYRYFHREIGAFVEDGCDKAAMEARFYALRMAIQHSLQLVVIELEPGDDPQIIFETLNARGQPLLPSDLIRNFVFMRVSEKESQRLYDNYWRHFDDERTENPDSSGEYRFWHMAERQGRLVRPRIDLFIFHYLTMKTEGDIRIGDLFREFRDWRDISPDPVETLLADLKAHSHYFRTLVDPRGSSRLETLARRLRSLDTSTVYPLLLFLASQPETKLPAVELERCVVDIESYLIRRFICWLTPKNYNRFFLSVLSKAKRAGEAGESIPDAIRQELLRSNDVSAVWPSDAVFRQGWRNNGIYVASRADRAAMVLKALEGEMKTAKTEGLRLEGIVTVEHLLPQKARISDYPFPIWDDPTDVLSELDDEQRRARLVHTVGNLTLLTSALNTSISNGPFDAKRREIGAHSDLRLNAWLRNERDVRWDEGEILARGELLFPYALRIWPKPDEEAATSQQAV